MEIKQYEFIPDTDENEFSNTPKLSIRYLAITCVPWFLIRMLFPSIMLVLAIAQKICLITNLLATYFLLLLFISLSLQKKKKREREKDMLGGAGFIGCIAFKDKLMYNVILLFCFL